MELQGLLWVCWGHMGPKALVIYIRVLEFILSLKIKHHSNPPAGGSTVCPAPSRLNHCPHRGIPSHVLRPRAPQASRNPPTGIYGHYTCVRNIGGECQDVHMMGDPSTHLGLPLRAQAFKLGFGGTNARSDIWYLPLEGRATINIIF